MLGAGVDVFVNRGTTVSAEHVSSQAEPLNRGSIERMLERMDRMFAAGQREDMAKLARKGCDVLVANEVGDGVTFGQDSSTAHLLRRGSDDVVTVGPAPKSHIAAALLDLVADLVPSQ